MVSSKGFSCPPYLYSPSFTTFTLLSLQHPSSKPFQRYSNIFTDFPGKVTGDENADIINSVYEGAKSGDYSVEGDGKEKKGDDGTKGNGNGTKNGDGSKGTKGAKGSDLKDGGEGSKAGNRSEDAKRTKDDSKNSNGTQNGNEEKVDGSSGSNETKIEDSKKNGDDTKKDDKKGGDSQIKDGDKDSDGATAKDRKNDAGGPWLGEEYGKGQNGDEKEEAGNRNDDKCREENQNKQTGITRACVYMRKIPCLPDPGLKDEMPPFQ